MQKDDKKPTSWNSVAGWYDELLSDDDTYQAKVILPNLLRLLPAKGKKVIDIACGQGFFSKIYAKEGAEVLGLDISPELIKIANKDVNDDLKDKLRFDIASADKLSPVKDNTFDAGMIILAIQNIKEMPETLIEASRVIKSGGTFVLVLNHPCFRIPQGSSWGFDEEKKVQYRRVDAYGIPFATKIDMNPGTKTDKSKVQTISFHRPLQEYFKALGKAGFVVTGIEEWISHKKSQPGPRMEAEDLARKQFPMFLAITARKD